jgi:peptide/nickel transport system permease protein
MARFIARRLSLSLITLWLLATIVFVIANVLPNDIGRTILGPFAPQETVDAFNERIGANDPLPEQYIRSLGRLVTLDFGISYQYSTDVGPRLVAAMFNSAKLAGLALLITVPISIAAGVLAARRRDTLVDRIVVTTGLTASSIPEFVTGTILVVIVGVQLKLLPVLAIPPRGEDPSLLTELRMLLLPALAMAIVYFGYLARMARAGTLEVLESDYTRTATMKGLTPGQTMRRHVLRNALVPTVAVVGVQIGYLFGGIIAIEKIFGYNGMGQLMLFAARNKDIPVLTAGIMVVGVVYMVATLAADIIMAWMNPRIRLQAAG